MIFNILKKDLKRKKTMNIIILLFVVLSTMFVASSVNNILNVANGTSYYFDKANLADYMVISMGGGKEDLNVSLEGMEGMKDYRVEDTLFISKDFVFHNGEKIEIKNTGLIQSLPDTKINLFDMDDKVVDEVASGHIYVTGNLMKDNDLSVGDKLTFKYYGVEMTFVVDGKLKDAFLGSKFMGNPRFLMNPEDYQKFADDPMISEHQSGQIAYVNANDAKKVEKGLSEIDGINFFNKGTIRMCYIIDMVVAAILIVLSVCLIVVAFVVLKFSINFTLEEEFREIGVMKAIGIKDKKIRSIYLTKYFAISVLGAVIGFFASIPFGAMLMKSVSDNVVLGNDVGIILNVISSLVVVAVIVAYAYHCTGKIKKYTPLDAIRSGQSGERFSKKSSYRIGKSGLKTTSYLALNDVKSSPKRYLTVILAFSICSILVFIIVNTIDTMKGDGLAFTFSRVSDVYYDDTTQMMEIMSGEGHELAEQKLDELEAICDEHGLPVRATLELQYMYQVEFNGETYKFNFQQGVRAKTTDYVYSEGDAPSNIHEVAITKVVSEETGAKIGDTIKVTINGKQEEYLITAYFQCMNQLGKIIRFHEDVKTDAKDASNVLVFQFDFTDSPDKKELEKRVDKMREIFGEDAIHTAAEYTESTIGVVDTMNAVKFLLLAITLIVVILVTILMERSFISDEKGEIAILKAIGFTDGSIVKWHVIRFLIVSAIAVVIAILLSVPMTNLCITPVFRMMGMESVKFQYDFLKVAVLYPCIILGAMLIAATMTALYTKKINCRDTASIE